ncbi:hypothetical protein [Xenorhabdus bovienii]|uniref:hypothetical protein n=1 Tax=Xenorhabdus bovienii TaxID=40576 RepID=UPI0023B32D18|nr:hypothetical protein [Xenorhabdus bovienii]MDE9454564.1 hypothetical protein [Xenorhabdus bovienii]MDE9494546.1 hypothetical protein [Xenorhabdus bovienii]MDE9502943.1 hypothetical protein [Xenorhabdus bovienii]MDE9526593.1 hypothetical protein [Xenorhabdus bovienii]MDE9568806.1 hypothetical protein [Xenorhabdus bovienii]
MNKQQTAFQPHFVILSGFNDNIKKIGKSFPEQGGIGIHNLVLRPQPKKSESVTQRYKAAPGETIEYRNLDKSKEWEKAIFVCYTRAGFVLEYKGLEAIFNYGMTEIRPRVATHAEKMEKLKLDVAAAMQYFFNECVNNPNPDLEHIAIKTVAEMIDHASK